MNEADLQVAETLHTPFPGTELPIWPQLKGKEQMAWPGKIQTASEPMHTSAFPYFSDA